MMKYRTNILEGEDLPVIHSAVYGETGHDQISQQNLHMVAAISGGLGVTLMGIKSRLGSAS